MDWTFIAGFDQNQLEIMPATDLVLISCYELGHQPLGLASPLAFLERAGHRARAIDISIEPFDENAARRARFAGISVPMHTALRLGIRVAERIRAVNPGCHICFYGLYASLNADYLLGRVADSVIGGEYEQALVALVDGLEKGEMRAPPGVSFRGDPSRPVLQKLSFPVPLRTSLPSLRTYARVEVNGDFGLVGYVESSRGCLHQCYHCPIPPVYGGRFFVLPRETVLEDIRQLVHSGATHITFGDPDFLNGPRHSMAIVHALHEEFPELTFDFTAKVEHLLKKNYPLGELAELGCIFIVSAAESLSDRVLLELVKGHTRKDIVQALSLLRQAGITFRPTWVPFTPWSTLDDYLQLIEWVAEEKLVDQVDPVQFTIRLLVPPGSRLLGRPGLESHLGPLEPETLSYKWTHPDPRMDALQRKVSELVEGAAARDQDPVTTFERIRTLAWSKAGSLPPPSRPAPQDADIVRSPRLTEAWFC